MPNPQTQTGGADSAEKTMIEAIARQRLVRARYNGAEMELAPHLLFTRHGDLFVSALNTKKNWRSEEERRLGHFKLAGLSDLALQGEPFTPLPDYDGMPPREDDECVFSVEVQGK